MFAVLLATPGFAGAVDFSLEYLSVPAVYQFMQADLADGTSEQMSKELGLGTVGLRLGQVLPPLFEGWPLRLGFEAGFGLPVGSQSFDETDRLLNASGLGANAKFEGDSLEWNGVCVPMLATLGFLPDSSGITLAAQMGAGVVLMDIQQDWIDSVYTGPLDDLDHVTTIHSHLDAAAFAVELTGGLVVPVTPSLSARLWGGVLWMSRTEFSAETDTSGATQVEGLQVGGLGFNVRVGLSSSL